MEKMSTKFNYIYSLIYSGLSMILPLVTSPYISRVIGAKGVGIYSYNYVIASYFATFALLGINFYGNRSVSKVRDNLKKRSQIFFEIYIMQIVLSLLMTIFYIIYVFLFIKEDKKVAMIMLLFVLAPSISINWFFNGLEMFKITVTRNIFIKIVTVICIFLFVKTSDDLYKYVMIMAIGTIISEGYLIVIIKKYIIFIKPKLKNIFNHFKPNLILFIPILAVSIYRFMDKIMLKLLINYEEVGYYTNSEKIINICLIFVTSLGQVMLPKMTKLLADGEIEKFNKFVIKSIKFVSFFSIGIMYGIFSVSNIFIPLFFGKGYESCIQILNLLSINIIFLAWGSILKVEYLIPKEKDYLYVISVVVGAVINFTLNIIFIPKLLAIGAAIGTICAEFSSLVIILFCIKKEIKLKNILLNVIPYMINGMIMFLVLKVIPNIDNQVLELIFKCIIGIVIYFVLSLFYWYITNDKIIDLIKKI